jgi:hypothetical protein
LPAGQYAKDQEKRKRDKHEADAMALDRTFIPFVLETFGTWGDEAVKFIRTLADNYSDDEDVADAFNLEATAAISFALQVGNAFVAGVGGFAHSKQNAERQQHQHSGARFVAPRTTPVMHVAPHSQRGEFQRRRALGGRMGTPNVVTSGGLTVTPASSRDGQRTVAPALPSRLVGAADQV